MEDLTEKSLLEGFDRVRREMRRPITPTPARDIRPPKPVSNIAANPSIDVAFYEMLARLAADAERRAAKEGRRK